MIFIKNNIINTALITIIFIIVIFIFIFIFAKREHIFSIYANTEIVYINTQNKEDVIWLIPEKSILYKNIENNNEYIKINNTSELFFNNDVNINVCRTGTGKIYLTASSKNNKGIGYIKGNGKEISLTSWALLEIDINDKQLIFPFSGSVFIGDDVTNGTEYILLSGIINIIEKELFGKIRYIASRDDITPGDRIVLMRDRQTKSLKETPIVNGFIRIDPGKNYSSPKNALVLIAYGQADFVQIHRYKSEGYQIYPSFWTRFRHDSFFINIAMVISFLVAIATITANCISIFKRKHNI